MSTANTDGRTLMASIKNVDNNNGNGMPSISYGSPINESSTFPNVLGSYAGSGLINTYYSTVQSSVMGLESLSANIDKYLNVSNVVVASITTVQA